MKKKAFLYIVILISFCFCFNAAALFNLQKSSGAAFHKLMFASADELPDDFDELLDDDYGRSEYSAVSGDYTLSLESVRFEKHYIKYSWFERDLSHIEVQLFIENSENIPINIETEVKGRFRAASGDVYEAYYAFCENYPQDTPLYYKAKIVLYFYPLPKGTDFADLKVDFGDNEFLLENINIVI